MPQAAGKNKVKVQKGQKEDKILVKEDFSDSDETAKEDGETETNSCSRDVSGTDIKKENKELTKFDLDIKEELEEFDDSIFDILLPWSTFDSYFNINLVSFGS